MQIKFQKHYTFTTQEGEERDNGSFVSMHSSLFGKITLIDAYFFWVEMLADVLHKTIWKILDKRSSLLEYYSSVAFKLQNKSIKFQSFCWERKLNVYESVRTVLSNTLPYDKISFKKTFFIYICVAYRASQSELSH